MYIELELLSDTCIGSGESVAGVIDTDIVFDKLGIPYIPAKRIKGVLRESSEEINLISKEYKKLIDELFGTAGSNESGKLKLSNGYIENYDRFFDLINRGKSNENDLTILFNEDNVKDCFTYIRTQTSINPETGVAKKGSLRNIRVIKKNTKFIFEINELCNEEMELLEKACLLSTHIGLNRTRGFGNVSFKLVKESKNENKHTANDISFKNKLRYKITLEEPIISDTDYINGGVLLGAIASKYIKYNKLTKSDVDNDDLFKELFLFDEVIYSNAYPSRNNLTTIPTPITFVKEKNRKDNEFVDRGYTELGDEQYVTIPFNYSNIIDDSLLGINVNKELHYHNRRAKDKRIGRATENDGEYFNYQAISSGTEFIGEILGSKDKLDIIYKLIKNNNSLYLGASKSAEYGGAKIEFIKDDADEVEVNDELNTLVLASPMIIRNKFGDISTNIEDLIEELDIKECVEKVFIKTREVGGFNSKWGLPKERAMAFKEGSVLIINDPEKAEELNNKYYGDRIGEGYGKVTLANIGENEEGTDYSYNEIRYKLPTELKTQDLNDNFNYKIISKLIMGLIDRKITSLFDLNSITKNLIRNFSNKAVYSNSNISNLFSYLDKSDSFEKFNIELEQAKERVSKDGVSENPYKKLEKELLRNEENFEKAFDKIITSDFYELNYSDSISNLFKTDICKEFINKYNKFELYKIYMNSIYSIIKYERRGN